MNPLTERLLTWYKEHKRDLPWRETRDPYKIWVSEVMLQQTRVESVKEKYSKFIETYPTLSSLAQGREEDVLQIWQGLGYYSRARRLLEAARQIGDRPFPEYKGFLSLPGVGEYTANAVFSMAFHECRVALDGNLLRIGARLLALEGDIKKMATRQKITSYFQEYLPAKNSGDFNQALMDLGSSVCIPKRPCCKVCPLKTFCLAFREGNTHRIPLRGALPPPKKTPVHIFWIQSPEDMVLLRRRAHRSFLQGLWELPWEERREDLSLMKESEAPYSASQEERPSLLMEYTFSHKHWLIKIKKRRVKKRFEPHLLREDEEHRWIPIEELDRMEMATVFRRVIERCKKES